MSCITSLRCMRAVFLVVEDGVVVVVQYDVNGNAVPIRHGRPVSVRGHCLAGANRGGDCGVRGAAMTAEREALLVRAGHVEARRQRAREQDDVDAMRHCERELAMLWRQWLEAFRPPKCQQQLAPSQGKSTSVSVATTH